VWHSPLVGTLEASFDDREMTSVKTSKAVLVAVVTDVVYQPE
jgi:hypothetical protein